MLLEGSIIAVLCFPATVAMMFFFNNGVFCSICNNYVSNVQFLKDFVLRLLSFADCVNAVFLQCNYKWSLCFFRLAALQIVAVKPLTVLVVPWPT